MSDNNDDNDIHDDEYICSSSCSSESFDKEPPKKKRKLDEEGYNQFPPITLCLINANPYITYEEESEGYEEESEIHEEEQNEEYNNKLQVIRNEINTINNSTTSSINLVDRVIMSNLDINTKANLVLRLEEPNIDKSDKNKLHTWVNQVLKLPIGIYKPIIDNYNNIFDINEFLLTARTKLDEVVYGMENTKEEIIDFLVKYILNPEKCGTVLGLKGPKGVGKTKLCRALSDILNLPLFQISMGGVTDAAVFLGHDSTYVGAKCGKVASIMQQAKCMNFILYIDEMDKAGSESKSKDVQGVLTHLLDETQNTSFQDLYFEGVPLDLSRVLFITSFNDEELVDPIVLNRIKILEIKPLTVQDKIIIVKNYILPEINYNKFNINDDIINYILTSKTEHEDGMRNIKKNMETIINRLNTILVLNKCKDNRKIIEKFSYQNINKSLKYDLEGNFIINENIIDILLAKGKVYDDTWKTMYM